MTMRCIVCTHSNRLQIDRALAQGKTLSSIAREYSISENSLANHRDQHLSRQLVQSVRKKEAIESSHLLDDIEELITRTKNILTMAEEKKKFNLALGAIREVRGSYELLCKIAVMMHEVKREDSDLQQIENEEQAKVDLRRKLKILTTPELDMLLQLNIKMETQNKSMIVIPKGSRNCTQCIHKFELNTFPDLKHTPDKEDTIYHSDIESPLEPKKTGLKRRSRSVQEPGTVVNDESIEDEESPLKVKPVEPTEIESIKWENHELNPAFELRQHRKSFPGDK